MCLVRRSRYIHEWLLWVHLPFLEIAIQVMNNIPRDSGDRHQMDGNSLAAHSQAYSFYSGRDGMSIISGTKFDNDIFDNFRVAASFYPRWHGN